MSDPFFRKGETPVYAAFFLILFVQIVFALFLRPVDSFYDVVPPVPTERSAAIQFLGDRELAYRFLGTQIQNFGDTGGNNTALKDYDFEKLSRWFFLQNSLNEKSDYIPFLAAYLFGGTQDPSKLPPVIDYLAIVGNNAEGEKWRWLAQAVYSSRFQLKDNDLALALSYKLSALYRSGMPAWTKQMPAFIQLHMGDDEAAYLFMRGLLAESHEGMHPNEVNFMVDYICNRLDIPQARNDPLCTDVD